VHLADLRDGVIVRRPAIGLFDQLAIYFILQLRVGQAHLQSVLSQRGVVIDRWRLDQNIDEELTGLQGGNIYHCLIINATKLPAGGAEDTLGNANLF